MEIYDFGLRLKELREAVSLSQSQAAKRLDVSKESISAYERNIQTPKLDTLINMAILYKTSLDYIGGLEKRKIIVLDGISGSQQETVEMIVERLLEEFKKK